MSLKPLTMRVSSVIIEKLDQLCTDLGARTGVPVKPSPVAAQALAIGIEVLRGTPTIEVRDLGQAHSVTFDLSRVKPSPKPKAKPSPKPKPRTPRSKSDPGTMIRPGVQLGGNIVPDVDAGAALIRKESKARARGELVPTRITRTVADRERESPTYQATAKAAQRDEILRLARIGAISQDRATSAIRDLGFDPGDLESTTPTGKGDTR